MNANSSIQTESALKGIDFALEQEPIDIPSLFVAMLRAQRVTETDVLLAERLGLRVREIYTTVLNDAQKTEITGLLTSQENDEDPAVKIIKEVLFPAVFDDATATMQTNTYVSLIPEEALTKLGPVISQEIAYNQPNLYEDITDLAK